jgi:hypothetical protein
VFDDKLNHDFGGGMKFFFSVPLEVEFLMTKIRPLEVTEIISRDDDVELNVAPKLISKNPSGQESIPLYSIVFGAFFVCKAETRILSLYSFI